MSLTIAFDIGYASLGWCVLQSPEKKGVDPEFLGTGVVTFPSDDCLASQRRNLRRTRRHIRSTRQRIERMKRWLTHRGVLNREALDRPGHPAPFLLAAAALRDHRTLDAWELWTVLRWYGHNRGYDGNSRWSSREEDDAEDTEKLTNARQLMRDHGTDTMCETVCACLKLDPAKHRKTISSHLPYKTLNAAYPRDTVQNEVLAILQKHLGKIPGLDEKTLDLLFTPEALSPDDRELLKAADIKLPRRYHGGLLFGQLVPRFDNRIISRCPITWAKEYDEAIASGKTDTEARKQADKFAKVPAAKSKEFLEYRFARILSNIKADGKPIDKELRATLWQLAEKQGRLTHGDLVKAVKAHCGDVPTNLEAYFKLHPDSEEALVLDPVMDEVRKAEGSRARFSRIWKLLSEESKAFVIDAWRKGKAVSFKWVLEQSGDDAAVRQAMEKEFADLKPRKGEARFASFEDYLRGTRVGPGIPSGRAPYARPVLRQVVEEVLNGWDPTKACKATDPEDGEVKSDNGVLYDLGIPTSRVRQLQAERPIDQLTNNHLVRHRMLILERLLDDILAEFCSDEKTPAQVVVEVARELKEFSGLTAKQIAAELNNRLKDFKSAVEHLREYAPHLPINGSLIRKCRIAMDLNWICPYTGNGPYQAGDLPNLTFDHIIPHATRKTNALHAIVLTPTWVNELKGKRTATQFIQDMAGDSRFVTPQKFEDWAKKHGPEKKPSKEKFRPSKQFSHIDDAIRCHLRRKLLLVKDFEDKELGFTEGQLTQTSQLMKLVMGAIRHKLPGTAIHPIPGTVTAEIRKAWKLTGTLALACPEILDENGEVRPKDEIRGLTHLHHALDAAAIALAAHYFPLTHRGENQTGKLWRAITNRSKSDEDVRVLGTTGLFKVWKAADHKGREITRASLDDLPPDLKNALARSLAQSRVMQHLPADRSGTKAELTTWGVLSIDGEGDDARVKLHQRTSKVEGGKRIIQTKPREERAGKLLGPQPKNGTGKLAAIKGAMIIGENYGLALDPEPSIISFHQVQQCLEELRVKNDGKHVRVLRNGMIIQLKTGPNAGVWRIFSAMGNMKLKIARLDYVSWDEKRSGAKKLALAPLLKAGLQILPQRYTGHPIID